MERFGGHGKVGRTGKGWEDMERLGGHVKVGRTCKGWEDMERLGGHRKFVFLDLNPTPCSTPPLYTLGYPTFSTSPLLCTSSSSHTNPVHTTSLTTQHIHTTHPSRIIPVHNTLIIHTTHHSSTTNPSRLIPVHSTLSCTTQHIQ